MTVLRAWQATVSALLVAATLWVPTAAADSIELRAEATGAAQVPPNPSKGTGAVTAKYDTETKKLTWSGTFANTSGQPIAAHFHGPAEAGRNAPVVVNIAPLVSPFQGEATLTEAQAADLLEGRWYLNIHTPSYPGGELRGQVQRSGKK